MYRVILVPTDEFAQREYWINAHTVLETDCGEFWDFVDGDGLLVRRLEKARVRSFAITPDRRKPRPEQASIPEDILAGVGATTSYRI